MIVTILKSLVAIFAVNKPTYSKFTIFVLLTLVISTVVAETLNLICLVIPVEQEKESALTDTCKH